MCTIPSPPEQARYTRSDIECGATRPTVPQAQSGYGSTPPPPPDPDDDADRRAERARWPTVLPEAPGGRGLDQQRYTDARIHERHEVLRQVEQHTTELRVTHRTRLPDCGTHCHELRHRADDSRRRIVQLACGRWGCPRCRARLLGGWMRHLADVITLAVTDDGLPHPDAPDAASRLPGVRLRDVWEWRGPATQWRAIHARIRRAGGPRAGYCMVRLDGGEIRVYADVAYRGADPVAPWLAAVRLADILRHLRPDGRRPITARGRWQRPRSPRYWTLGEYAGRSLQAALQVLDDVGLSARLGCADEAATHGCVAWLDYRLPDDWTDDDARRLIMWIAVGEAPPPGEVPPVRGHCVHALDSPDPYIGL